MNDTTQPTTKAPPTKPHGWIDYGTDHWASPYSSRKRQRFMCKHGGCNRDAWHCHEANMHNSDCPLMAQRKQEQAERAAKVRAAYMAHDWNTSDPLAMELAAASLGVRL